MKHGFVPAYCRECSHDVSSEIHCDVPIKLELYIDMFDPDNPAILLKHGKQIIRPDKRTMNAYNMIVRNKA